jgi:hypothetical protein
MYLLFVLASLGYSSGQLEDARAAVAVAEMNIEIAQGPALPITVPKAEAPEIVKEPAPTIAPADTAEVKELREKLRSLEAEYDKLIDTNQQLGKIIEQLQKDIEQLKQPAQAVPPAPVPKSESPIPSKPSKVAEGGWPEASPAKIRLVVAAGADPIKRPEVTIDYWTASWCQFCPEMTKRIEAAIKAGLFPFKVVKHHDTNDTPRVNDNGVMREGLLPMFAWRSGSGESLCHEGLISVVDLQRKILFDIEPPTVPKGFGAEPAGLASIHGREAIGGGIRYVKSVLGQDVEADIKWVRNGDAALKVGDKWSRPQLIGTAGRIEIELRNTKTKLPVSKVGAAYDWPANSPRPKITLDPVEIDLPDGTFGAEPAGSPLMVIWTAWSLVSLINDILHPSLSLNLGNTVMATAKFVGDALHVSFVQPGEGPPKRGQIRGVGVTLHWLIDWPRRLTGVSLDETAAIAEFDESKWWRRVTLPIN